MTLKKNNPGCDCCNLTDPPCLCSILAKPCFDNYPQCQRCYLNAIEKQDEWCSLVGNACEDLRVMAWQFTASGFADDLCLSCSQYNGTHYLCWELMEGERVGVLNGWYIEQQNKITKARWKSADDAYCGTAGSTVLPAWELEWTWSESSGYGTWRLYANTKSVRGGVATFSLDDTGWACGEINTLSQTGIAFECVTPSSVDIEQCNGCFWCDDGVAKRAIYEYQIDISGVINNWFGGCSDLNGTFVLPIGDGFAYSGESGGYDGCAYLYRVGTIYAGFESEWTLQLVRTAAGSLTFSIVNRWGELIAEWNGTETSCSASVVLTRDSSVDPGYCNFGGATVTATPL